MATFYVGYKPILKSWEGANAVNPYTGKVGVYSNWSMFSKSAALDGAPDYNVQPGTGVFPHDLTLSRWFLGLDPAGTHLADAGILYPDVYSGRYNTWLYNGAAPSVWKAPSPFGANQGISGYGHLYNWGGTSADTAGTGFGAPYASLGYFYYGLVNQDSLLKNSATVGHLERYPSYSLATEAHDQPFSFGAFEPYIYKGVISQRSDPLSSNVISLGHPDYAASGVGVLAPDRYGFEHTMEWRGVPSAKAL